MPAPTTKTLYCSTGSFSGSRFPSLYESPQPVFSASAWGWNMGQNNPPSICEMNSGIEIARGSAQWQSTPTASIPNNNAGGSGGANSWIAGPYNGEFLSGSWQITMSVKAVTSTDSQVGNMFYRFWKGTNISGSNASLISTTYFTSSRNPAVGGGTAQVGNTLTKLTSSVSLPSTIFRNEYLFIQTYWSVVTNGGNNNDDEGYVFGPTASLIRPTEFVANRSTVLGWMSSEDY